MKINAIDENRLSILAKKGPIQVFQAKYSYNPIQHSPNENPDAELPIDAGDYVLVYGEMDEVRSIPQTSANQITVDYTFRSIYFHRILSTECVMFW